MSHKFRFFTAEIANVNDKMTCLITGEEHIHLAKVLRLTVSTEVEIFDGNGMSGKGSISQIRKNESLIEIEEVTLDSRFEDTFLVAASFLKIKVFEEILPDLIELGADEITFYTCDGAPSKQLDEKIKERHKKIVLAACKQCKRNFLPQINYFYSLEAMVEYLKVVEGYEQILHLSEKSKTNIFQNEQLGHGKMAIICGSEKGYSKKEEELLNRRGIKAVSVAKNTLRAKTALRSVVSVLAAKRMLE